MQNEPRQAPAHEFRKTHAISGRASSRIVRALTDRMSATGWAVPPISVVEYGGEKYILDGHHRSLAARHAKIMVRYRTIEIDELSQFGYSSMEKVVQAHAEAGVNRIDLRR